MKALLPLLLVLMTLLYVEAQIPPNIIKEFNRQQPGARFIEWKEEKGKFVKGYREKLYRVTYTNWYRQTMVFNPKAEIVTSESELPPKYVPDEITKFMYANLSHTKWVVWDSFNENNERSFFVICNESRKIFFSSEGKVVKEISLVQSKQKKLNLLSFISD